MLKLLPVKASSGLALTEEASGAHDFSAMMILYFEK
jgi:hypothetical protein